MGRIVSGLGVSFAEAYRLRRRASTVAAMAPSLCSTLPGIGRTGGGVWYPYPHPSERLNCRSLEPRTVTIGIRQGRRTRRSTHPSLTTTTATFLPLSRSGAQARAGDNDDEDVTPISGFDVIVKNVEDVENASAARDDDVPVVAFNGGKDGDVATGAAAGVSHARGKESASKSG